MMELPMWDGDRYFLPLVFDPSVGQFHGVIPYDGGHSVGWRVSVLPGT
jgi:8-oxo-dGTP diphosphatase